MAPPLAAAHYVSDGPCPSCDRPPSLTSAELMAEALHLLDWGWPAIPIHPETKRPAIKGATGRAGQDLTGPQIQRLRIRWHGIGIRMPHGHFGLDLDTYKGSGRGRPALLHILGPQARDALNTAPVITARELPSGIHLFRMPTEWATAPGQWPELESLPAGPDAGIEIIQRHHRHANAPPTLHPSGRRYQWILPDGRRTDQPPFADDVATAPPEWLRPLTRRHTAPIQDSGQTGATVRHTRPPSPSGAQSGWRHDRIRAAIGQIIHQRHCTDPTEIFRLLADHPDVQSKMATHGPDPVATEIEHMIDWHLTKYRQHRKGPR